MQKSPAGTQLTAVFGWSTASFGWWNRGVPIQANRASYVPYFYSRDGYAALGHSNVTHFNRMAARWEAVIPLMGTGFCRVSDNQLAQLDSSPTKPITGLVQLVMAGITQPASSWLGRLRALSSCTSCLLPPFHKAHLRTPFHLAKQVRSEEDPNG